MTALDTDPDLIHLEDLDWQQLCDVTLYHPLAVPPAAFVMHGLVPQPCGCTPPRPDVLLCTECRDRYLTGVWFGCPDCGARLWSPTTIREVVPL